MEKIFDPEVQTVYDLMKNNLFQVPVYQRPYSWGNDELKDLYSDIVACHEKQKQNSDGEALFLGTLYLKNGDKQHSQTNYHIIDGQQRITSLTILLLVLYAVFNEKKLNSNDRSFREVQDCLWRYNAVNRKFDKEARVLTLGSIDEQIMISLFDQAFKNKDHFRKFIKEKASTVKGSNKNIISAAAYFFEQLEQLNEDDLVLFANFILFGIQVVVITVTLQLKKVFEIFEAINSKGKKLDNIDLIKSYIFQLVPEDDHGEYLRQWGELISKTDDRLEDYLYVYIKGFIKFYRTSLSVKYFRALSDDGLKSRLACKTKEEAVAKLIDDMQEKVKCYIMLSDSEKLPKELFKTSKFMFFYNCLNYLGYQHPKPLLLKALYQYKEKIITKTEILNIFRYCLVFMISYQTINSRDSKEAIEVFENILNSDYGNNKLDVNKIRKIFESKLLAEGINKAALQKKLEDYKGYAKSDKSETRVFLAFYESFTGNKVSYDQANVILTNSQAYSIDHILPQNPTENKAFSYYPEKNKDGETVLKLKTGHDFPDYISSGMDYESFKDQTLHKLGNLRITFQSTNSSKQNNKVKIEDYNFETYKDVINRNEEIANKLYDSDLLSLKD